MRGDLFLILFFLIISNSAICIAECNSTQIDLNSATKEKLDNLYGIGPARAEEIINSRPFDSVDDLINVNGIGQITLDKIKNQGLACVKEEEQSKQEEENEEDSEENETAQEIEEEEEEQKNENKENTEELEENTEDNKKEIENTKEPEIIRLNYLDSNSKDIKTDKSTEVLNLDKIRYAIYGVISFCILFLILILLKLTKKKNELQ